MKDVYAGYYSIAEEYFKMEKYAKASEFYEKCLLDNDELTLRNVKYKLAQTYLKLSKWKDASKIYEELLQVDSENTNLKTMLEKEGVTYEIVKEEIVSIFGKKNSKPFYMEYTNSFKKTLENSILFSKKKGEDKVSSESLAICMLENSESVAKELLVNKTENLQNIIEELKKQVKKSSELDSIFDLTNLNNKALKNPPVLIHREKEINLLMNVLLRKQKQNAIIVGDPGVGKTALVEYLAHLINIQQVPTQLIDKTIY